MSAEALRQLQAARRAALEENAEAVWLAIYGPPQRLHTWCQDCISYHMPNRHVGLKRDVSRPDPTP